jgi:3-dehydroquinate dehydratase I
MLPMTAVAPPGFPLLVGTVSDANALCAYAALDPVARDADIVELRLDLIARSEWSQCFAACDRLEASSTAVLVTLRHQKEGGQWAGPEPERVRILTDALAHASWVDVETGSEIAIAVAAEARRVGKRSVLSFHDFSTTPALEALDSVYQQGLDRGADVVKIAAMVTELEHHGTLFDLVRRRGKDGRLCAIGMGPSALSLRLYLPVVGSVFAYSYLGQDVAPGQLSCARMRELLRLEIPNLDNRRARARNE